MRKRRLGKKKKLSFKGLVIIFVAASLFFSVGYSLLVQDLTIGGTANLGNSTTNEDINSDDLKFNYNRGTWYSSGKYYYQLDMSLENISTDDISDWKVIIDVPDDTTISNNWNGNIEIVEGKLVISDSLIVSGETLSFGCQISTTVENFDMSSIILNGTKVKIPDPVIPDEPSQSGIIVDFVPTGSWKSGNYFTQYDIVVRNEGDANISSWSFKLTLPTGANMQSVWNANYIKADSTITFSNVGHNGNIAAGSSITFGGIFSSTYSKINILITDITSE